MVTVETSTIEQAFQQRAKSIIKAEMVRRQLSFDELAGRLSLRGYSLSGKILNAKINRATFSAAFFLEVLDVVGVKSLDLNT